MLTGRLVKMEDEDARDLGDVLGRLAARSGEPAIRQAMIQAMRIMGPQFVMGRTIEEGLGRAASGAVRGCCYSYDMLGRGARTRPIVRTTCRDSGWKYAWIVRITGDRQKK